MKRQDSALTSAKSRVHPPCRACDSLRIQTSRLKAGKNRACPLQRACKDFGAAITSRRKHGATTREKQKIDFGAAIPPTKTRFQLRL